MLASPSTDAYRGGTTTSTTLPREEISSRKGLLDRAGALSPSSLPGRAGALSPSSLSGRGWCLELVEPPGLDLEDLFVGCRRRRRMNRLVDWSYFRLVLVNFIRKFSSLHFPFTVVFCPSITRVAYSMSVGSPSFVSLTNSSLIWDRNEDRERTPWHLLILFLQLSLRQYLLLLLLLLLFGRFSLLKNSFCSLVLSLSSLLLLLQQWLFLPV